MTRSDQRRGYEPDVRLSLLESDVDELVGAVAKINTKIEEEMGNIRRLLVGLLVSVTTAALLLVINIFVIVGRS